MSWNANKSCFREPSICIHITIYVVYSMIVVVLCRNRLFRLYYYVWSAVRISCMCKPPLGRRGEEGPGEEARLIHTLYTIHTNLWSMYEPHPFLPIHPSNPSNYVSSYFMLSSLVHLYLLNYLLLGTTDCYCTSRVSEIRWNTSPRLWTCCYQTINWVLMYKLLEQIKMGFLVWCGNCT